MRKIILAAAAVVLPNVALAHVSIIDHAHPHAAAHPYLGVDSLLLMAGVAAIAGVVAYAFRKRLWSDK